MIKKRNTNSKLAVTAVVIIGIIAVILLKTGVIRLPSSDPSEFSGDECARVSYIDVGQGDCELISLKSGENILIDSGNYSDRSSICDYLNSCGVEKLDMFILTHPHNDHIGSAATIIETFPVDLVLMTDITSNTTSYEKLLDAILKNEVPVEEPDPGKVYTFGDITLTVLAPVLEYNDVNESSIVVRLCCDETSFLFTGDAGHDSESDMLETGRTLRSSVLKIGHHGSSGSTTDEFLSAVAPEVAVISCGLNNSYGHPHDEILEKLEDADVEIFRTDTDGNVVITSDGKTLSCNTEK